MEMNYDEQVLHQLEQELHVEIVPGTEIMADVGSHHFVKSGHAHHVLVPQPSDDPHDPLNWSRLWKWSAIYCACLVSFAQGMGPLALAPQIPYYMEDFHHGLADILQFTGVCILVLGFSNFIWVPISTSFGRRPVYLLSTIICLGSNIWRAVAKSYGSFMGACVLNGIGAGPAETIAPAVIADIIFLHDRGKYNTLYFVCYFGSLMIGPIISGPMADHVGWRSFWWLNVGLHGFVLLCVLFLFPETRWHRVHPDELRPTMAPTVPPAAEEKLGADMVEEGNGVTLNHNPPPTSAVQMPDLSTSATAARDPYLGRGGPSKKQYLLWQKNVHWARAIVLDIWVPWKLFAFPIVEFASFVVSWTASSFLTINLTQSQVFAAPPYNFSSEDIGFFNFSILIGAFIGLATAGPLSDWFSMRLTRRNRGIREPEMRLPTMIPYVLIMILGNVVTSVGYQYSWDWRAIVIIGYSCAGIQVAALPAIASTYAIDSYKPVAGSVFVSITVNKNVWGYGFSKFVTPWIEQVGYIPPIMTNMALITLWCLFGILFYFYGKTFRRWSKNSSVHRM